MVLDRMKILNNIKNSKLSWPTTAQRCRSETEKFILEDFFSSVLLQFKKYFPSGNLKLNNLGDFQSLKFRISTEKNPSNVS